MSGSLQQRLDQIRDMQGRDPMPSGSQSPFGPGDPPPPLPPLTQFDPDVPRDWIDPELDEPDPAAPPIPSPMIPQAPRAPVQNMAKAMISPAPLAEDLFGNGLVVASNGAVRMGSWRGRQVELTTDEEAKVREIVLLALRRELDADLEIVTKKRPKRLTQGAAPASGEAPTSSSPAPAPRKRGRPRGSLLR